jgi:hypothetical protein
LAAGWRVGLVAAVAAVGILIWRAAMAIPPAPAIAVGERGLAATFLTTVIAIYAVFLSVYGTLLAPLLDRRPGRDGRISRHVASWTTIILVVTAILLGLWRVWNAVGDLYTITIGAGLGDGSQGTLNARDALEDFRWIWAPLNITIIGVAMHGFLRTRVNVTGTATAATAAAAPGTTASVA